MKREGETHKGDKLIYERSQSFTRMLLEHKLSTICKSLGIRYWGKTVNKADMVSRHVIINSTINQIIISMPRVLVCEVQDKYRMNAV